MRDTLDGAAVASPHTLRRTALPILVLCATSVSTVAVQRPRVSADAAMQILDRYSQTGDAGALSLESVDEFTDLLQSAGTAWTNRATGAEHERRRQVLALFALEVAADAGRSKMSDGLRIIEWACGFLRRRAPSEFERRWMLASSSLFLREDSERNYGRFPGPAQVSRDQPALDHLGHALGRFPQEPRLRLARLLQRPEAYALTSRPGVDPDHLVRGPSASATRGPAGRPQIQRTLRDLDALTGDPESGAEARAHIGWLRFHLGELASSREELVRAARETTDPFVRNLAWLGVGLALDAEGREREATAAYQSAVNALPLARASAIQLATHLQREGRRREASELVSAAFGPDAFDLEPWRHVLAFDRLAPSDLAQLRSAVGLPSTRGLHPGPRESTPPGTNIPARPEPVLDEAGPAGQGAQTQFRSRADAVTFDVLVEANKVPVDGLTAADFEVIDNGRPQTIEVVQLSTMPLDVSLVVDFFRETEIGRFRVSRVAPDDRRIQISNLWMSPSMYGQVREGLTEVSRTLKPTDRLRVLQVDGNVGSALWPFQPAPFPIDRLPQGEDERFERRDQVSYGRQQGLYDVAAAALLHESSPDRRHLVVVFTDGIDGASVLPPSRFMAAAEDSGAVMYLLRRDTQMELAAQENIKGAIPYAHLYWPPDPRVIEEAAVSTGGTVYYHPHGAILPDFARILDRFRHSYVIRYQPTDANPGRHDVSFKVTRPGSFQVKARRGYTIR